MVRSGLPEPDLWIHSRLLCWKGTTTAVWRSPWNQWYFATGRLCVAGWVLATLTKIYNNLVGGLEHFLFFHILGIILPTDELIFFRGVGIPPTRQCLILLVSKQNKCWIFLDDGAGVAQFIKDESWQSGVRMCSARDVFPCPTRDSNSRSWHGGFHEWRYPFIAGWFLDGKIPI